MRLIRELHSRFLWWLAVRYLKRQFCGLLDMPEDLAMLNLTRWRWKISHSDLSEREKESLFRLCDGTEAVIRATWIKEAGG